LVSAAGQHQASPSGWWADITWFCWFCAVQAIAYKGLGSLGTRPTDRGRGRWSLSWSRGCRRAPGKRYSMQHGRQTVGTVTIVFWLAFCTPARSTRC